ncbi:leucine-rich repeat domain-containing protein [Sphingobacterium sp.]|uniref:leucine-rich repeat domain-containing protein n=1 Tax=Sphingobacterium sp. TaxID=341027 RepID=UPI0028B0D3E3|nr:leucine-rich repeat domain-containing protein [Sphingobacterium sp.]
MEKYLKKIVEEKDTIKKINLSEKWLEDVPEVLKECKLVEEIKLTGNNIYEIPDWLFQLPHLKKLDISLNDMETLPANITKAQHLEFLAFDSPIKKALPKELAQLKKLKKLVIHEQIYGFPDEFFELTSLEEIEFYTPKITSIPDSFSKFVNLKSFTLTQLLFEGKAKPIDFEAVVEVLSTLPKLENLSFSLSGMLSIPENINKLQGLKELNLSGNGIKVLPKALFELNGLRLLDLGQNGIKTIPADIKNLNQLRTLKINSNFNPPIDLQNLFNSVKELTNLQDLQLWSCQTTIKLPENIAEWTSLRELDIDNNKVKNLPASMQQMTWLKKLRISTNPIPEEEKEKLVKALKGTKVIV